MRRREIPRLLPGLACAALSLVVAFAVHAAIPALPAMTVAVALGLLAANVPPAAALVSGRARPGLDFAGKSLMRGGIVMLGLKVGLVDVLDLGWASLGLITGVVLAGFGGTYAISRLFRLAPPVSLLVATGFAICGASAIGAMADARRIKQVDTVLPVALVTLCGTLAIAALPLLMHPLGLDPTTFGAWTGASVHDVGQVVATAQTAGTAALAVAVVVKLTRVLLLAPVIAVAGLEHRLMAKRAARSQPARQDAAVPAGPLRLPPVVPLFILGFLLMVALRSSGILAAGWLEAGAVLQDILLGAALFGLGSAVRIRTLLHTGLPALAAALLSWLLLALLGLAAAFGIAGHGAG